eukprot:1147787-Pelagomonas_calceolata.AAC.1
MQTLLQNIRQTFLNQAHKSVADTGIPGAGLGRSPFPFIFWSAEEERREHTAGTSAAPTPSPKITYLPNLQNALKSHLHLKRRIGYANSQTGYYSYYQSSLPHVEKKFSNAFRNMPCTLYNQKHAVRFKRSTNPLCPLPGCHQLDSALHMLSGCQNHIISSMKTERNNVAGRMITKDLS